MSGSKPIFLCVIGSYGGQSEPPVPFADPRLERHPCRRLGVRDKPFGATPPPAIQCAHVELRTGCAKAWHKARGLKGQ